MSSNLVSIGFRAKTARAIVVVLGGPRRSPVVLAKTEIKLADPRIPATFQPYHEVMDLSWEESQRAAQKYIRAIERVATKAVAQLIDEQRTDGRRIAGVGIVGAPDRDLSRIGNSHIRAHAAEGVLYRHVLDLAAEANGLRWQTFTDRKLDEVMSFKPGSEKADVRRKINELGRDLSPPWRADEKQAATAAWLMLHGSAAQQR